jgi:ubiquinone/menaquinone biosynthesis C-methylase UbiE
MKKFVYDLIYSESDTHYGHKNHGKVHLNTILEFKPESWLDVGCGFNEMIKEVRDNYVQDSWGIDFSCPGADQQCDILDLPFPDNRWDFISAFDVMEHIYPDKVSIALEEMRRVSKRFVFTIAFTKAFLEYKGVNAHPTVWSREVWYETIENAGGKIWDISKDEFFIGEWI